MFYTPMESSCKTGLEICKPRRPGGKIYPSNLHLKLGGTFFEGPLSAYYLSDTRMRGLYGKKRPRRIRRARVRVNRSKTRRRYRQNLQKTRFRGHAPAYEWAQPRKRKERPKLANFVYSAATFAAIYTYADSTDAPWSLLSKEPKHVYRANTRCGVCPRSTPCPTRSSPTLGPNLRDKYFDPAFETCMSSIQFCKSFPTIYRTSQSECPHHFSISCVSWRLGRSIKNHCYITLGDVRYRWPNASEGRFQLLPKLQNGSIHVSLQHGHTPCGALGQGEPWL